MKPVVIYVDDTKKDRVELTKKELEKLLSDAYEQGKKDGTIQYVGYPVYQRDWWYTPGVTWTSADTTGSTPDATSITTASYPSTLTSYTAASWGDNDVCLNSVF